MKCESLLVEEAAAAAAAGGVLGERGLVVAMDSRGVMCARLSGVVLRLVGWALYLSATSSACSGLAWRGSVEGEAGGTGCRWIRGLLAGETGAGGPTVCCGSGPAGDAWLCAPCSSRSVWSWACEGSDGEVLREIRLFDLFGEDCCDEVSESELLPKVTSSSSIVLVPVVLSVSVSGKSVHTSGSSPQNR